MSGRLHHTFSALLDPEETAMHLGMASRARLIRVPGPVGLPFYIPPSKKKEVFVIEPRFLSCLVTVYLGMRLLCHHFLFRMNLTKSRRENSDPAGTAGVALHLQTSYHLILIHLRRAFPVFPESSHGNVISMYSQRIDLCDGSRLCDSG